jgi:hypothetical protein
MVEMRGQNRLRKILDDLSDSEHYLFTFSDFSAVFPELSYDSLRNLLSRAERNGILERVCNGIYLNPRTEYPVDLVLYHTAAKLRDRFFNYLSLETVLSDAGVISQMPINWISLMSSGRTYTVRCGRFGTIEYVHTKKKPEDLTGRVSYDTRCNLWRAHIELALQDMRYAGRSMDLVNWSIVDELA